MSEYERLSPVSAHCCAAHGASGGPRAPPQSSAGKSWSGWRRSEAIRIFLTPEEAVSALRSLSREVAGLTYGWASPDHPDVTGEYLANVRRFLRHPLGEHVTALFWECAAAPDPPRTQWLRCVVGQAFPLRLSLT